MKTGNPSGSAPRFLLAGNGPYANRGCEAIVRGTVELLSRRFPGASFVLSSFGASRWDEASSETDPRIEHRPHVEPRLPARRFSKRWIAEMIGLRPRTVADARPFRAQVDAMAECDCALLLGGDNYTLDYGRPSQFVDMNNALLATGKPVVLWGASVGPFTADPGFENVMGDHLRSLNLVLARESETIAYLASIGVEANVRAVADPAFAMQPVKPALPDDLQQFVESQPFGLNFSPLAGLYRAGGEQEWADTVGQSVVRLMESGVSPVLLVPHVTIDREHDNDYRFLLRVGGALPGWGDSVKILPATLSAAELKWVISRTRAFAGARMHATIAALSAGVPTVFIGYSPKYRGISKDIFGHEDWLIPVDSVNPDSLSEKFHELLRREEEVRTAISLAIPDIVQLARRAADYIAELLEQGGFAK